MMRYSVWLLLAVLCCAEASAQAVLHGRVLTPSGGPPALAHVEASVLHARRRGRAIAQAQVDADGRYTLPLSDSGLYRVTYHGALLSGHEVALYVDGADSIRLDVRMARAWLDEDLSFARLVGSFNGFDYATGLPLAERDDGAFAASLPASADTLTLRLMGVDSLAGRVVLLDFTQAGCAACREDEEVLRQAEAAYGPRGFTLARVALGERLPETAPGLRAHAPSGFVDGDVRDYDVRAVPHRVLIDRDGVVLAVGEGLWGEALRALLGRLFDAGSQ